MTNRKLTFRDVPSPDDRDPNIPIQEWENQRNAIKMEIAAQKEQELLNKPTPIFDAALAVVDGVRKLCTRIRGAR